MKLKSLNFEEAFHKCVKDIDDAPIQAEQTRN